MTAFLEANENEMLANPPKYVDGGVGTFKMAIPIVSKDEGFDAMLDRRADADAEFHPSDMVIDCISEVLLIMAMF